MSRLPRVLAGAGAAAAALVLVAPTAALADPPGNNGTIKIDPYGATNGHANAPHPGCDFRLQLFGFDKGQTGTITFVGQAPTKGAVTSQPLPGTQQLSSTKAGGGKDVDAYFDLRGESLGLTGTPAKQGYHVKVLVDPDNAPDGAKSKVFWLNCPGPTGSTTSSTETGKTETAGTNESGTTRGGGTAVTAQSLGSGTVSTTTTTGTTTGTVSAPASSSTGVTALSNGGAVTALDDRATGGGGAAVVTAPAAGTALAAGTAPTAQTAGGALPFTGLALGSLVAVALGALGVGALAVRAGRRRTATIG